MSFIFFKCSYSICLRTNFCSTRSVLIKFVNRSYELVSTHSYYSYIPHYLVDYSLQEWSAACRKCIEHDLPKYGGLHFRDLPIPSVEQFAEFFTSLGYEPLDIVGIIGYRTKLNRHVFTASDDPKHYSIELHTESSHMHRFPLKVRFLSEDACVCISV